MHSYHVWRTTCVHRPEFFLAWNLRIPSWRQILTTNFSFDYCQYYQCLLCNKQLIKIHTELQLPFLFCFHIFLWLTQVVLLSYCCLAVTWDPFNFPFLFLKLWVVVQRKLGTWFLESVLSLVSTIYKLWDIQQVSVLFSSIKWGTMIVLPL